MTYIGKPIQWPRRTVDNHTAVLALARALKAYDDCNPDVGMGWFWSHFVDEAMKQLDLTKDDVNYDELIGK
jgi:hypothetical protein